MTKFIYKYVMPEPFSEEKIELPVGIKFIHVGKQGREIMAWAEVDPTADMAVYPIATLPTGARAPKGWDHLGTILDGIYVWHVYAGLS